MTFHVRSCASISTTFEQLETSAHHIIASVLQPVKGAARKPECLKFFGLEGLKGERCGRDRCGRLHRSQQQELIHAKWTAAYPRWGPQARAPGPERARHVAWDDASDSVRVAREAREAPARSDSGHSARSRSSSNSTSSNSIRATASSTDAKVAAL